MLADSANAQPSTNAFNLNVQQSELDSIYIENARRGVEAAQISSGDTNPMLNGGRSH